MSRTETLRRVASNASSGSHSSAASCKAKLNLSYEKLKMYFALDTFIVFSCAVSLSLFAFNVIEMHTAMYFIPPFFCLSISTLFFVTFIAWFTQATSFSNEKYELSVIVYALRSRFICNALIFIGCIICVPFFWKDFVNERENYERLSGKNSMTELRNNVSAKKDAAYCKLTMVGSGVVTCLMIFPVGILMLESFQKVVKNMRDFYLDIEEEDDSRELGYIFYEGVL